MPLGLQIDCFLPLMRASGQQRHPGQEPGQTPSRQATPALPAPKPRKARLLWLLPLPLVPATVIALASGQFTAFIANAAAALFLTGALLALRGFVQEVSQARGHYQRSWQWPFKTLGALTIALATTVAAWAGVDHGLPIALAFGISAFAAFVLLYGLDPR